MPQLSSVLWRIGGSRVGKLALKGWATAAGAKRQEYRRRWVVKVLIYHLIEANQVV